MLSALSFAIMYIGALSGVFDLCAVVIASLATAFAVIEMKGVWPWLVAAVTGTLSILLLTDKFAAVEYIVLGGIYPIIKSFAERLPRLYAWLVKLVYFNVMLTLALILAKYVILITEDWAGMNVIVYACANVFFIVFDYAMTMFISIYVIKLRKRLKVKL